MPQTKKCFICDKEHSQRGDVCLDCTPTLVNWTLFDTLCELQSAEVAEELIEQAEREFFEKYPWARYQPIDGRVNVEAFCREFLVRNRKAVRM